MKFLRFWTTAATLTVFAAAPAMAIVVFDEDFEDDTPATSVAPNLNGPPINPMGKPGRWIPNQYVVPALTEEDPWYDPLDGDPDTNWQFSVTSNIGPDRPGNEGFFRNQHSACDLYYHCVDNSQDCEDIGLTETGPCDNDRYDRDGLLQFTNPDGTPRPAVVGDVLRGRFDYTSFDGITVFALVNDIHAMAASTADQELHPPVTKWDPGFGKPFHAIDESLQVWRGMPQSIPPAPPTPGRQHPQNPNIVSLLTPNEGYNGRGFDVWVPIDPNDLSKGQNMYNLDPDFPNGGVSITRPPASEPGDPERNPYQTYSFAYTVGEDHLDAVFIDYNDGNGPQEVRQGLEADAHGTGAPPDPGGLVPVGQPGLLDPVQNPDGPNHIEGFVFSSTGQKMSQYLVDNICFVVNGNLDECGGGAAPLLGDANNDSLVTGQDLITVQQNFGTVGPPNDGTLLGDANNDGLVTGADLISVQQNFGKVAAAAPEPAAIAIFAIVGLIGGAFGRLHGTKKGHREGPKGPG